MKKLFAASVVLAFFVSANTQATISSPTGKARRVAAWDNWWNRRFDKRWNRRWRARWIAAHRASPTAYAVASWYYDTNGACAAGYCAQYGVANLSLPFGTHVTFYYQGRSVDATVDDRGPYVSGRTWDLDERTAAALGFSGVAPVGYRIGS